jgi:aerobic carbon-monoxide dehydrogenase small subunit
MTASLPKCEISLTVNGQQRTLLAYPAERLLDVLRNQLCLTGTKEGCGEGECGSCSVLVNGDLVTSCLIPVLQAQNASIVTIEGIAKNSHLHFLQQALLECGGAQCGICTPGITIAAYYLLSKKQHLTAEHIRNGLAGNLCRCTGYSQICEAVLTAASQRQFQSGEGESAR